MATPRKFPRRSMVSLIAGFVAVLTKPLGARAATDLLQLRDVVRIPLQTFTRDWQQQAFEAWVAGADDRLFFGSLLRLPSEDHAAQPDPKSFLAYCTFCSHEACEVKLLEDTRAVKSARATGLDHPLVVCPCHSSVFDPQQLGRLLSGPAPRGLYRFKFHSDGDYIVITHIERAAMALFQS